MSVLAWIWIGLGVITLFLAAFRSRWFWLVWMLQLIDLGFFYSVESEWSIAKLGSTGLYAVVCIYGAMRWFQNPQKIWQEQYSDLLDAEAHEIDWESQKQLQNISVEAVVGWVLLVIVVTAGMTALFKYDSGRLAGLVGLYHSLGILGGLLIAHRIRAVWLFWLGKSALGIWLFAPNLYMQFAEFGFLIVSFIGLLYWRLTWKKQQGFA